MNIYFKESHGRCLGTYPLKGQQLFEVIKNAYNVGYRFFDTAQMYENESDLGQSIKKEFWDNKNEKHMKMKYITDLKKLS